MQYITDRVELDARGCWNWKLAMNESGYGLCFRRDWRGLAHRFSYTMLVGPILEGLQIDHLCMNRACVNPRHLEPVSAAENIRRASLAKFGRNYSLFHNGTNGLWCASIEIGSDGKRARKSFHSKAREKAVAKIEAWLEQNQQPTTIKINSSEGTAMKYQGRRSLGATDAPKNQDRPQHHNREKNAR